jgi:hypothetical protein
MSNLGTDLPLLHVRIVRSANDPGRFVWRVLERQGTLLQSSTKSYSDDRKALRDANAAARKIVRLGSSELSQVGS